LTASVVDGEGSHDRRWRSRGGGRGCEDKPDCSYAGRRSRAAASGAARGRRCGVLCDFSMVSKKIPHDQFGTWNSGPTAHHSHIEGQVAACRLVSPQCRPREVSPFVRAWADAVAGRPMPNGRELGRRCRARPRTSTRPGRPSWRSTGAPRHQPRRGHPALTAATIASVISSSATSIQR
jgi:hypothetical protein